MASKNEIIAEIEALTLELNVEVEIAGKNKPELEEILKSLKEQKAEAESEEQGDQDQGDQEQKAEKYVVAKNKSLTTKKGIKTAGDLIEEKIIIGGSEDFKNLIKKGYIVEK